jgi:nitroreductase
VPDKIAATEHEILDLIAQRWSPRAFSAQVVEPEKVRRIFEAARWAPSCFNEQPWSFFVASIDDQPQHEKLAGCLGSGNAWARKAPVLVLSVAALDFAKSGKPNRWAYHDVGLAVENLVLQTTSMGLLAHQMAGFDAEKARDVFEIPPRYDPVGMIAVGYVGDPDSLTEDQRLKELSVRQRKTIDQFVYGAKWSEISPLVERNR